MIGPHQTALSTLAFRNAGMLPTVRKTRTP